MTKPASPKVHSFFVLMLIERSLVHDILMFFLTFRDIHMEFIEKKNYIFFLAICKKSKIQSFRQDIKYQIRIKHLYKMY